MNTNTIAQRQRAVGERLHNDDSGPLRGAHVLPTPTRRTADDPGSAPRPRNRHHHRPRYRVRRPGQLPITGLSAAGRIVTPDLPLEAAATRHRRDASVSLHDIARQPCPFTTRPLNPTVGAGRGRIEGRHRRSPT
jgi:hypothetical protein